MLEKHQQNWFGLRFQFDFNDSGLIDWSRRPFRKTWSWRKLGSESCEDLILSGISPETRCLVAVPDVPEEELATLGLGEALAEALKGVKERPYWLIDCQKRWIIELTPRGALTLERLGRLTL